VLQTWNDHKEPLGTLPAIGPAPVISLIDNGGEKWAASYGDRAKSQAVADWNMSRVPPSWMPEKAEPSTGL
jgi:hypothetical protein